MSTHRARLDLSGSLTPERLLEFNVAGRKPRALVRREGIDRLQWTGGQVVSYEYGSIVFGSKLCKAAETEQGVFFALGNGESAEANSSFWILATRTENEGKYFRS